MHVRTSVDANDTVLVLTTENGRISLSETNGNINLHVDDETMAAIPEDKYIYDLELVGPSKDLYVYKLLTGNFVVRAEVTR